MLLSGRGGEPEVVHPEHPGSGVTHPAAGVSHPAASLPPARRHPGAATTGGPAGGIEPVPAANGAATLAFHQEMRDPGWAADQERELTARLRRIVDDLTARGTAVDIDGVECRRTQCRVDIHTRDAAALGKLYGSLESGDGLYGWADTVVLDAVETAADGQVETHVTAVFDRD